MAVLNIRVDDVVQDRLKERAEADGVTVSELVRRLVMEEVVPVRDAVAGHGEVAPPESMGLYERQVLSLLHRIYGRVLPADGDPDEGDRDDQQKHARILENGFTGEYWYETVAFRSELSTRDCDRVNDILEMFRIVNWSIEQQAERGNPVDDSLALQLQFRGFDFNHGLEGHMAQYVKFLMSDDRWEDLQEQFEANDGGNSHTQVLDMYLRMLGEYRQIMDARGRGFATDYLLSAADLQRIADARIHPSHRDGA